MSKCYCRHCKQLMKIAGSLKCALCGYVHNRIDDAERLGEPAVIILQSNKKLANGANQTS